MKYKKMNKKGIVGITIALLIAGAISLLGLVGGVVAIVKIKNIINSIPIWGWVGLILLLVIMIMPRKK